MDHTLDAAALHAILSHLEPRSLCSCSLASSTLATVVNANSLWQPLLQQDFGLYIQAAGSQGVDLQSTYKQLASSKAAHALRFAAVYTDGGCDGMPYDLTYWADHAFQPNCYSPHCSDGKSDISIVALLQPNGCELDVQLAQHRQYLVARCAPAAALLFGPPGGGGGAGGAAAGLQLQSVPQAAASLAGWSSVGLERLFMDLYQDLVLHQQGSTWGRLLLRDVPANQVPQELLKLDAAAQRIEARQGHGLYSSVQQAARHMYDSKQLEWVGQQDSSRTTALVHEVAVSRVGHFTCPLAAGALLLGQHPAAAATAAPGSSSSSSADGSTSNPQLQQVLALKHDPAAAALDGANTLDQVLSAVAAGLLPPVLQQGEGTGVQWVEFAPLDAAQREARAQRGWYMRPVVWFRFSTPQQAPLAGMPDGAAATEPQQQQQQHDVIDVDEDKMHEYDDPAEEPNIDVQCVLLRGVAVQLQQGLQGAVTLL
ncbi:hypothetical protein OEZ85_004036 [Tetradesmus obliquus]|uniref:F-box domain-containing protein n=1 Tax=Tetradesmus obliquus TaxID=3088 RepID=A0ABY8UG59_TETOB|nr:hypothetical protein OEZ85_004036 [Tetradesmus obliquus]